PTRRSSDLTTADRFWLVRGRPAALWSVGKDGTGKRKFFEFDPETVPSLLTTEFSPDGGRLAVGVATTRSFHRFRDLAVVDLATGKAAFQLKQVPVGLPWISSHTPMLSCTWLDARR